MTAAVITNIRIGIIVSTTYIITVNSFLVSDGNEHHFHSSIKCQKMTRTWKFGSNDDTDIRE